MDDLRETQQSFARKAQAQPEHRFGDLYHLICREEWLRAALQHVLSNAGSRTAGIDGISRKQLKEETAQSLFLHHLRGDLKPLNYTPHPRLPPSPPQPTA